MVEGFPYRRVTGLLAAIALGFALTPALAAEPPSGDPNAAVPRKPEPTPEEQAAERARLLTDLLGRLRTAEDRESATLLEQAIWKLWLRSGSPTIDLLMSRAVTLMNERRLDAALSILDIVVKLVPDYAEGWNKRATVYYLKQELRRSQHDIAKVLALEPRHFGALSGLGLVMRALGNKKAALEAFRRALEIHPFLPAARQGVEELTPEVEGRPI